MRPGRGGCRALPPPSRCSSRAGLGAVLHGTSRWGTRAVLGARRPVPDAAGSLAEGRADSFSLPKPEKGLKFWVLEIIPEDESCSEKPRHLALVPVAGAGFPNLTWTPCQEDEKSPQEQLHPLSGEPHPGFRTFSCLEGKWGWRGKHNSSLCPKHTLGFQKLLSIFFSHPFCLKKSHYLPEAALDPGESPVLIS